jgi:[ribosomal protein S5]-alanine N-acetyltransferase
VPAPDTVTTDRLVLRRVTPADRAFLLAMWSDAEVTKTLGGPREAEQVQAGLDAMVDHWARRGFGNYIVHDRRTDEPIGWAGLKETDVGGAGGVEVLYAIAASHWRQGIATEAARAVVEVARGIGLPTLVCFTLADNEGSQRTMAAAGFSGREEVEHVGLSHVLARLDLVQEAASHG